MYIYNMFEIENIKSYLYTPRIWDSFKIHLS